MPARSLGPYALALLVLAMPAGGQAADFACNGLVPLGQKMICPGFEPNWALELSCAGDTMTANFVDAFSGSGIVSTPGSVAFTSSNPWTLTTSQGVSGSIAYTPAGCRDEGDNVHDFTFTPAAAPGVDPPFFPFCCRIE
jgi:hypothetical protein